MMVACMYESRTIQAPARFAVTTSVTEVPIWFNNFRRVVGRATQPVPLPDEDLQATFQPTWVSVYWCNRTMEGMGETALHGGGDARRLYKTGDGCVGNKEPQSWHPEGEVYRRVSNGRATQPWKGHKPLMQEERGAIGARGGDGLAGGLGKEHLDPGRPKDAGREVTIGTRRRGRTWIRPTCARYGEDGVDQSMCWLDDSMWRKATSAQPSLLGTTTLRLTANGRRRRVACTATAHEARCLGSYGVYLDSPLAVGTLSPHAGDSG